VAGTKVDRRKGIKYIPLDVIASYSSSADVYSVIAIEETVEQTLYHSEATLIREVVQVARQKDYFAGRNVIDDVVNRESKGVQAEVLECDKVATSRDDTEYAANRYTLDYDIRSVIRKKRIEWSLKEEAPNTLRALPAGDLVQYDFLSVVQPQEPNKESPLSDPQAKPIVRMNPSYQVGRCAIGDAGVQKVSGGGSGAAPLMPKAA